MKISYAITVCNEFEEIQKLIPFLLENKREEDEIVIQQDNTNLDEVVYTYLKSQIEGTNVKYVQHSLNGDFSQFKNNLTDNCTGDYIFQIDADEMPTTYMLDMIPEVLKHNDVDVLKVPRINTVEGLTQEHVDKWNWNVNNQGWVNFPDFQWRVYKNDNKIKWKNPVHEVLDGYQTISYLPINEEWCFRHHKVIEKQEQQNKLYEGL